MHPGQHEVDDRAVERRIKMKALERNTRPVPALLYDVRESDGPEGGLLLGLHAEGKRIATARARAEPWSGDERLGWKAADVRALLEEALVGYLMSQYAKVDLAPPVRSPADGRRFVSRYVYRDADDISVGLVWYDASSSATGPDDLPTIVRSKMRFEVHRKLTEKRPSALGVLLRILDEMSS